MSGVPRAVGCQGFRGSLQSVLPLLQAAGVHLRGDPARGTARRDRLSSARQDEHRASYPGLDQSEAFVVKVIVDADACPRGAMEALRRLTREHGCMLITVASFHHAISGPEHVVVGDAPGEADLAVANRTDAGDIVVTQDLGLASLVIGRGAHVVTPMGDQIDPARLDFMMEERHIKAKVRRGGGRTKGPRARTSADDARFERTVRRLMDEA